MGNRRLLLFILVPIVMLAGAGLFAFDILESLHSADWPSVSGTIVGHRNDKGCGIKRGNYFAQPIYTYKVGGVEYVSNRVTNGIGQCASSEASARQLLDEKYPLTSTVTVYFDPANPQAAFLVPGKVSTGEQVMLALLIAFALLVLLGLWKSWPQLRRGSRPAARAAGDAARTGNLRFRKTFKFFGNGRTHVDEKRLLRDPPENGNTDLKGPGAALPSPLEIAGDEIVWPGGRIKAPYRVIEAREIAGRVLVVYDYTAFARGGPARNLFAYDLAGQRIWRAEDIGCGDSDAYTGIMSAAPLVVANFAGFNCTIDLGTGKVLARTFTK